MSLRTYLTTAALGLVTAWLASCNYQTDPNYCPGNPHNNCLNDAGPILCQQDPDCSSYSGMMVCDTAGTQTCVQCTPQNHAACEGATPACIGNTCQACTAHDQCDSKACLIDQDGTCAKDTDVAYVQSGGAGSACTLAAPCGTLAMGVATGRPYVKIAVGMVKDSSLTTISGKTVSILADPGAVLGNTSTGSILVVRGDNTNVSISDLRFSGATGTANAAVQLDITGGAPSLSLVRVSIDGNQGRGLLATGGSLTISRSVFIGNARGAIDLNGAQATFDITNNYIMRNGDELNAEFGAVNLKVTNPVASRFEFNTITDNSSATGTTRSGGVICDIPGFTAANNILARNRLGSSMIASNAQTLGACTYPSSKVQSDVATLGFESPDMNPLSYKLMEGSSAIDQATTPSSVMIDFDGDMRPQGTQKDIGADELRK